MRTVVAGTIRILSAVFVVAIILMVAFPNQTGSIRAYVTKRRNGCSSTEALAGLRYTLRQTTALSAVKRCSRIVRSDPAGYDLWRTPFGYHWAPTGESESLFFTLAEMESEPYTTERVSVRNNDIVLDCGAHVGIFTRKALATGAAKVIAVEPGQKQVECLRRNLAAEIMDGRVIIVQKGAWKQDGILKFYADHTAGDSFVITHPGSGSTEVLVTTIDSIVAELDVPRVDFIKMDIEAAEREALAGAALTLRRFKPRLAIAGYHEPDDFERIPEVIRRADPTYSLEKAACRLDLPEIRPLTLFFH